MTSQSSVPTWCTSLLIIHRLINIQISLLLFFCESDLVLAREVSGKYFCHRTWNTTGGYLVCTKESLSQGSRNSNLIWIRQIDLLPYTSPYALLNCSAKGHHSTRTRLCSASLLYRKGAQASPPGRSRVEVFRCFVFPFHFIEQI